MTINSSSADICSKILDAIQRITQRTPQPILVALDGASSSGKSTLASMLEQRSNIVVVPSDGFFAANIPDWEWDTRSVPERARDVLDWQRLRKEALELLLENKATKWHPFDFAAGIRSDGTYGMSENYIEKQPAPVIILEGAYSSNPTFADLIDLKILMDVPVFERHQRLEKREENKQFLKRWHILCGAVEEYYFSEIMPASSFDLVVTSTGVIENSNT